LIVASSGEEIVDELSKLATTVKTKPNVVATGLPTTHYPDLFFSFLLVLSLHISFFFVM
jgi:hypothetical protein